MLNAANIYTKVVKKIKKNKPIFKLETPNTLFDLNRIWVIKFLVSCSIIYFSPKNKEVYIKIFLMKVSANFFKKKSIKNPDCALPDHLFFLCGYFNKKKKKEY